MYSKPIIQKYRSKHSYVLRFLLIACDGLFKVFTNQKAIETITKILDVRSLIGEFTAVCLACVFIQIMRVRVRVRVCASA